MTVVLLLMVTVQVVVLTLVHPLQEENGFPPVVAVAGAVSVTEVPELYVRVKPVEPLPTLLASLGEAVMVTPLEGLVEFTVST